MDYLKVRCLISIYLVISPNILVWLISNLILLNMEGLFCIASILFKLLRCVLLSNLLWSVLENVPCVHEKNMNELTSTSYEILGYRTLYVSYIEGTKLLPK